MFYKDFYKEVGQTFTGQTEQVIERLNRRTISIRQKHTDFHNTWRVDGSMGLGLDQILIKRWILKYFITFSNLAR